MVQEIKSIAKLPHAGMPYFRKIDGLRCIAIFLVLLEHFARFIGHVISAGFYGVDLFFVISGFLITGILINQPNSSFSKTYLNFIGRRTFRIFPIYYLTVLILWLAHLDIVRTFLSYLLSYTFNFAMVNFNLPVTPVSHFWSLNIEEQFYLFWPFVVLSLKKRTTALVFITAIIVMLGYTQLSFNIFSSLSPYNEYGIFPRMASLGLGALGAILTKKNLLPARLLKHHLVEYLLLLLLVVSLVFTFQFKPLCLGFCSLYLVLKSAYYGFSLNIINKFLVSPLVIYIGTISYGIYVYHLPMEYYLSRYVVDPIWNSIDFHKLGAFEKLRYNIWIIKFPLYSLLSVFIAALSFKYIERPILVLKNRYFIDRKDNSSVKLQPVNISN